jgi:CRP-like cAMP-binding protein
MRSLEELLSESKWAHAISDEHLRHARNTILVRDLRPGNYACHRGDAFNMWLGVIDGLMKAENRSECGKPVTFAVFPPNSWFGEGTILKDEPRKYDIVALRESRVALMPSTTFFWLLDRSVPFSRFIINQLNERLGQFLGKFEHDCLLEVEARVAHTIADMFNPQLYPYQDGRITITNEELAHVVGASRQTINQTLRVLEEYGLIKVAYRTITVPDIDSLRNFGRRGTGLVRNRGPSAHHSSN